jgi:hypothetical protein
MSSAASSPTQGTHATRQVRVLTRKSKTFTKAEDAIILAKFGSLAVAELAELLEGHHELWQIEARFKRVLDPKIKKGNWSKEEDGVICEWAESHNGIPDWKDLPALVERLPGRLAKQVRERWTNVLDARLSHEPWTKEEDEYLLQMNRDLGHKFALMSRMFDNRRSQGNCKTRLETLERAAQRAQKEEEKEKEEAEQAARRPPVTPPVSVALTQPELAEAWMQAQNERERLPARAENESVWLDWTLDSGEPSSDLRW